MRTLNWNSELASHYSVHTVVCIYQKHVQIEMFHQQKIYNHIECCSVNPCGTPDFINSQEEVCPIRTTFLVTIKKIKLLLLHNMFLVYTIAPHAILHQKLWKHSKICRWHPVQDDNQMKYWYHEQLIITVKCKNRHVKNQTDT